MHRCLWVHFSSLTTVYGKMVLAHTDRHVLLAAFTSLYQWAMQAADEGLPPCRHRSSVLGRWRQHRPATSPPPTAVAQQAWESAARRGRPSRHATPVPCGAALGSQAAGATQAVHGPASAGGARCGRCWYPRRGGRGGKEPRGRVGPPRWVRCRHSAMETPRRSACTRSGLRPQSRTPPAGVLAGPRTGRGVAYMMQACSSSRDVA